MNDKTFFAKLRQASTVVPGRVRALRCIDLRFTLRFTAEV